MPVCCLAKTAQLKLLRKSIFTFANLSVFWTWTYFCVEPMNDLQVILKRDTDFLNSGDVTSQLLSFPAFDGVTIL